MPVEQSRRRFLTNAAFAGATGLVGAGAFGFGGAGSSLAAEPPPEITAIRLAKGLLSCIAPLPAAAELLRAEGFADVRYVAYTKEHVDRADAEKSGICASMIAHGEVDFARDPAPNFIAGIESGAPVSFLAGLHSGCFFVIGKPDIRSIADLRGRTVWGGNTIDLLLLKIMASYVGLDPERDINWIRTSLFEPVSLLVAGSPVWPSEVVDGRNKSGHDGSITPSAGRFPCPSCRADAVS